jgi:hypothetical protein
MLQMGTLALLAILSLFSSMVVVPHLINYNQFVVIALTPRKETAPIADPGPDITAHGADIITLDGSKSFDRDGDPIVKYHWSSCYGYELFVDQTGLISCNAEGKTVTVQVPSVKQTTDFGVDLTVSDGKFNSNPPAHLTIHALPAK